MHRATLRVSAVILSFCIVAGLTCCGGSASPPCTGCPPPVVNAFLLASTIGNQQSGQLLSFPIDVNTGALGTPLVTAGPAAYAGLTIAGQGTPFLYAVPQTGPTGNLDSFIYGYQIDPNSGAVTQITGSPFDSVNTLTFSGVVGAGVDSFLYLPANSVYASGQASSVVAMSVGADGSLTPSISGSPFPVGPEGTWSTWLSTGPSSLYVAESSSSNGGGGGIAVFSIDSSAGVLTSVPGSPFSVGPYNGPGQIIYDPLGFVYAPLFSTTIEGTYLLQGFSIGSNGALTPLAGAIEVGGSNFGEPVWLGPVVDGSGKFLFAGTLGQQIMELEVDPTTGMLSPLNVMSEPAELPFLVYGNYLYAPTSGLYGSTGPPAIRAFSIDENTGALTEVPGSPFLAAGSPIFSMAVATTVAAGH